MSGWFFGNWGLANPAGLWLSLLTLPIIALHILKPRRVRQVVAAVFLWSKVERPVTAARPWQRLIPSWLLAAQVLAALLLALIVARPVQLAPQDLGEHTIFVVDASASMQATDGTPTRLDDARDRAKELRRQVPGGGEASLITAGANARALLTRSGDTGAFDRAVDGIEAGQGEADFVDAFALAAGLNVGDRPTRVVLISDGGVDPEDLRLVPAGTRYERVGSSSTNRGISQIVVEPADDGLVVRLTVRNVGGPPATVGLRVDVDGVTVDRRSVELDQAAIENLSIRVPPGEKIEAFLDSEDAYDLDDRVVATIGGRADLDVAVVGPPNRFLDTALAVVSGIAVDRLDAIPGDGLAGYDLVIADRVTPPPDLDVPVWLIAPPGGGAGVDVAGEVDRPALTLIQAGSPLVSGLDLGDLLLARSQQVTLPADAELVLGAEGAPLLARIRPGPSADGGAGFNAVYQSFAVDESNLPLLVAFPVLVDRVLTELSGSVIPPARLPVGSWLPVDARSAATITDPEGSVTAVSPGAGRVVADRIGFWSIEYDSSGSRTTESRATESGSEGGSILVAVNPIPGESEILPAPDLAVAGEFNAETGPGTQAQIPLRRWFIAALLAVVAAEWLLARRRIGVGRPQWNLAQALRGAIALALIATFFDLGFNRPANDPATVFIVDGSDSMAARQAEAADFVTDALAVKPDDARAGVIAFGANARLENLVSPDPIFGGLSVDIDAAGTDLAAAVRLGAATVPNDARGRLVVLTDGRATAGDLADEVGRLVADGLPVDVVPLDQGDLADVAVSSVSVPSQAQAGERVQIEATVFASVATRAEVALRRDNEIVETRVVDLAPGDNTVVFDDIVGETDGDDGGRASSVARYQVDVTATVDPVAANNRGFAAVPITGVERVLVVDGDPADTLDQTAPILAALDAAGLTADAVDVAAMPPLDELIGYSSIVLVNVDAFDLSSATIDDLTTVVRDLGRGMVVIGGDQSFALGGYLSSDLEDLLPIISEITDPLRRQTVAEVFAIDTSGSMGACHCNEEGENGLGGGNRIDGGVEKTAIARNATAKAIAALSATDEVGVLTMDNTDQWVIDLQPGPSQEVIDDGLSQLAPNGPTFIGSGLDTAAEQLRESNASLKHIILFSDGFTEPGELEGLAARAADLYDSEGITTSVVATGEGAAEDLRPVAEAGGGRFYPGRNLEQIPDILAQEAVVASRSFVNEGEFPPLVTSSADTVRTLTEAPVINGYVAVTAKDTARVDLRIGPDNDPLLTSWRTGLGRVSVWASDSGTRWNRPWAGWDGSPDFWARVVKETFPIAADGGGVAATIDGDRMTLRLEGSTTWDDDARATARVTGPDGVSQEVALERLDGETFSAVVPVDEAGVYAVGATVTEGADTAWTGIGLSTRSYPAEYSPATTVDPALGQLWSATGGREALSPADAFSTANTEPGSRRVDLWYWLLWFAVLAWPIAVALSRLAWRRGVLATVENRAAATVSELRRALPRIDRPQRPDSASSSPGSLSGPSSTAPPSVPTAPPEGIGPPGPTRPPTAPSTPKPEAADPGEGDAATTLDQLLKNKRNR